MKFYSTLSLILLISVFVSQAQQKPMAKKNNERNTSSTFKKSSTKSYNGSQGWLSLNLNMGLPMQEFKNSTSSLPFGGNFNYYYQPSENVPLMIGFDMGYLGAGNKTINRTLTADISVGGVVIDQLNIPLEFRINNNILNGHVNFRFLAPTEIVKPYVDGIAGFNYLWTATELYDRSNERYFTTDEDNRIYRKSQLQDFTYSIGMGGGILFQVGATTFVNLGAHYAFGGNAEYYDRDQIQTWDIQISSSALTQNQQSGSLDQDDIAVNAIPKKSKTDMLLLELGLTFSF
jgi:hypothetical protein